MALPVSFLTAAAAISLLLGSLVVGVVVAVVAAPILVVQRLGEQSGAPPPGEWRSRGGGDAASVNVQPVSFWLPRYRHEATSK